MSDTAAPLTARAVARRELTAAILAEARRQLADVGPASLSVRAVARELGMASSAVYRYFRSRDELITALLVAGYDELGETVEQADAAVTRRSDGRARWRTLTAAVRDWARAHPHDWALLYGSPVPGYAAPADTVSPATRVLAVLVEVMVDARPAGEHRTVSRAAGRAVRPVRDFTGGRLDDDAVYRALTAWAGLLGLLSLELYGHLHNAVDDFDAWFVESAGRLLPG